jgi:hypothetical protein
LVVAETVNPPPQTYLENLRASLFQVFESTPAAILLGEDVVDPYGGAFKVSKGLSTHFPDRVLATPWKTSCSSRPRPVAGTSSARVCHRRTPS